jgi:anti-sigma B factor antagonist
VTDADTIEPTFEIDIAHRSGHTVVEVSGELDVFSASRLRQALFDPVLCCEPHVVVDLDGVTFMDSTGIGTLVAARRWLTSRDSAISLVCTGGPALRLLEMVCLDKVFDIHDSVRAATGAS